MKKFEKKTLKSGITLITQPNTGSNSIIFSVGIRAGSRYENKNNSGIGHLLEHIVYRNISELLRKNDWQESYIHSTLDAYTGKEYTKYFFSVNNEDISVATKILSEIFQPSISMDALSAEISIIEEEIAEENDDVQATFDNDVALYYFGGNPLSASVLGDLKSLKALTREDLLAYLGQHYDASRSVVVVTGSFEIDTLNQIFGGLDMTSDSKKPALDSPSKPSLLIPEIVKIDSKAEQAIFTWKFMTRLIAPDESIKSIFFANLLSEYLNYYIRDRGMCYTLEAGLARYHGFGVLEINSSFGSGKIDFFAKSLAERLISFRDSLDEDTLEFAKESSSKAWLLDADNPQSTADFLLNSYLQFDEVITVQDVVKVISKIQKKDVDLFYERFLSDMGRMYVTEGSIPELKKAMNSISPKTELN